MTDKITLELTLDELKLIDKYVELNDETKSVFDKIKVAYPISPVEEAFKDWWGQYPETGTWDNFDKKRWQGFQAGYEFAYAISTAKEVMEKVQKEQEVEPSMTNCVITGNPPDGYVTWQEWYNELGSKGILHNLRISSIDYKPTPQEPEEQKWDAARESVKWCEEHPDKDPLDWLKPQTPEQTEQGLKEAFREAVKQGVVSSVEKSKDDFMDKMVAELKGQTLTDLIWNWWGNVFTSNEEWDAENAIEHLVDLIEAFLPKSQSSAGSQNAYVECTVEGFNDCLNTIKRKLR